jgi:hypothetical protein
MGCNYTKEERMAIKRRKNKCSIKEEDITKESNKGSGELTGSSLEEEGSIWKWQDYEVKMLIAIRVAIEKKISRCANFFFVCINVFLKKRCRFYKSYNSYKVSIRSQYGPL